MFEHQTRHTERLVAPVHLGFFATDTFMADRAVCETDESMLQLLPYIVVTNEDDQIFMYQRGDGGDESRLHSLYSIGLGGHMDTPPPAHDLLAHMRTEAIREVKEEIGVVPAGVPMFFALLIDRTNPVGRVHLGILGMCQLHSGADVVQEQGSITNGRWVTRAELLSPEIFDKLEPWSQMAVNHCYTVAHHPV